MSLKSGLRYNEGYQDGYEAGKRSADYEAAALRERVAGLEGALRDFDREMERDGISVVDWREAILTLLPIPISMAVIRLIDRARAI